MPSNVLTKPPQAEDAIGDFLTWTALGCDYERTAAALRCSVEEVHERAVRGSWERRGASAMRGGAIEQRAINRALQFVTATRLRTIVDNVVAEIAADPDKREEATTEYNTKGVVIRTFKNFKYLAEALDICNAMARGALGDSVAASQADEEETRKRTGASLSTDVAAALNKLEASPGTSAVELVKGLQDRQR